MMPCPRNDGVHYEKGPPRDFADVDFAGIETRLMAHFAKASQEEIRERVNAFNRLYPKVIAFKEKMWEEAQQAAARVGKRCVVLRTTRVVTC